MHQKVEEPIRRMTGDIKVVVLGDPKLATRSSKADSKADSEGGWLTMEGSWGERISIAFVLFVAI